jgi:predicted RNase H-like HicB family nuclease
MYEIVIERSDDAFKAYCPALPGCSVQGASKEEVLERIYEEIPWYTGERTRWDAIPKA